jgi:hypothetical protein
MPITSKYAIVCDEVRREDNGKLIFLGVYIDKMIVSQFPITLPTLTIFHMLNSDKPIENVEIKFRFENIETQEKIVEGAGELEFPPDAAGIAIFRLVNVKIPSIGKYHFVVELGDQAPLVQLLEVATPEAISKSSNGKDI